MFGGVRNPAGAMKREAIVFSVCFSVVLLLHLLRILAVRPPALELLTLLPAVLLVSLVIYGATLILRVLYGLMARFWNGELPGQKKETKDENDGSGEI
jgi:hypothetical protein